MNRFSPNLFHSGVNASKCFCVNCLCNTWNSLPETVVEAPSVAVDAFRRIDTADFAPFCVFSFAFVYSKLK